jgi:elongation of very long chain fatty acids protein 7
MLDVLIEYYLDLSWKYNALWDRRDRRVDSLPLMDSPWPTLVICLAYIYIVKRAGPDYMRNRRPMEIKSFLVVYNAFQVALSTYIFGGLLLSGWSTTYSWRCQPVDYSNDPMATRMAHFCYIYYISKFTEFIDTFCFVARKKNQHVSMLHVVHHSIMPLSVWPGVRFVPGGHASFFCLLNTFVHIIMYTYYMLSAMGPKYHKYIWWKQHMTSLQMVQFVGIMVHGFQLLVVESCGFPWQYGPYIAAHGLLFFILFSSFYTKEYFSKGKKNKSEVKKTSNGLVSNGHASNGHASNGHVSVSNGHVSNGHASHWTTALFDQAYNSNTSNLQTSKRVSQLTIGDAKKKL